MKQKLWSRMIDVIKMDVVPATGCTEPISLALAAANAAKYVEEEILSIDAHVSANLMKNGMGVMVPGTGLPGLYIAAAIGALGGNPNGGLQVLNALSPTSVEAAKKMVESGKVQVSVNYETDHILYADAHIYTANHEVKVVIVDSHTNIISIEKDGEILFQTDVAIDDAYEKKNEFLQTLTVRDIVEFAENVPLDKILFIQEAEELNAKLSKEGLSGDYGLRIGYLMQQEVEAGFLGDDLQNRVVMHTAAASDARMGGAPSPAMTNSGSGNQGITATVPVTVVADHLGVNEESRIRAIALANMMAIYIHGFLPKLSGFCATVTAAMGAGAGMIWLLDKEHAYEHIEKVIASMTGDACGMICDGAANSCAMKVSTSVSSAFRSVLLALKGIRVSGNDGLVANSVEESIRNIGHLATDGMKKTDEEILHIMLCKNQ